MVLQPSVAGGKTCGVVTVIRQQSWKEEYDLAGGLSVIIPTYNRATLLPRALESVFAQTRPVDEIIVVDDGSTDNTEAVVAERTDGRLRYVRQDNAGPAAARNRGIKLARYDWLAFLDSDDEWMPEKLARQAEILQAHSDVGLCFADTSWTLDGKVMEQRTNWAPRRKTFSKAMGARPWTGRISGRTFRKAHAQIGVIGSPSTVVAQGWVFDRCGGFRNDLRVGEDYEMWLRASRHCDMYYLDEPLAWAHAQDTSLCCQSDLQETFRRNWRAVCQEWLEVETDSEIRTAVRHGLQVSMEASIYAPLASRDRSVLARALSEARAEGWSPTKKTPRLIRLANRFGPRAAVLAHRFLAATQLA